MPPTDSKNWHGGKEFVKCMLNKRKFIYTSNRNTTMKKVTNYLAAALVAVAIFIGSSAKAQTTPATSPSPNPWRLGFGIEGGIPTGDLHPQSGFELGGSARLQYDVTSDVSFTLTSGYTSFFIKDQ